MNDRASAERARRREFTRLAVEILPKVAMRWVLVFAATLAFALIALELSQTRRVGFDAHVMEALRGIRSDVLTRVMLRVTSLGDGEVLAIAGTLGTLTLWLRGHPRSAAYLAISSAGAALINTGLKLFFQRQRPDALLRLADTSGFAFPSGHSMGSAAVYGAIAVIALSRFPRLRFPLGLFCVFLVGAVGMSRAYLFVHFPSDVVAGWALGLAWLLSVKALVLGKGFSPHTTAAEDLRADGIEGR